MQKNCLVEVVRTCALKKILFCIKDIYRDSQKGQKKVIQGQYILYSEENIQFSTNSKALEKSI